MPPRIDRAKCRSCGICIFQCGKHVFAMDAEKSRVSVRRGGDCVDCFICEINCPAGAVSVRIAGKEVAAGAGKD